MNAGHFIRNNTYFLIPAAFLLCTGIVFLALYPKEVIHLTQNGWYHPLLDPVFKWGTNLGDGVVFVGAILGLATTSYKRALAMLYAALLTLVLVGVLKQLVFPDELRPFAYFKSSEALRLIEGVENHSSNSFPSGHTTAAFACYGLLAFYTRRPFVQLLCIGVAAFVGYSRIYLSQHFLEDVVAGGFLGIGIAGFSYYLGNLNNRPWSTKGLLNRRV